MRVLIALRSYYVIRKHKVIANNRSVYSTRKQLEKNSKKGNLKYEMTPCITFLFVKGKNYLSSTFSDE